jgi:uncharacterized protein YqcC (DUF446 family)/ubiquinone/menaquinone biosynthesis C-methylase UbiE
MASSKPVSSIQDVFDIADRYCEAALLQFAHAAGLFETLTVPLRGDEVATTKNWIPRKTGILLDALVSLGLLDKAAGAYRISNVAAQCLVRAAPNYIGGLVEHERLQWALWGRMEDVLSSENPVDGQQDLHLPADAEANRVFHSAMAELSLDLLEAVVSLPEWTGKRYVIDLAGGHGTYLATLATRHPELHGEVWDLPSAALSAEATFQQYRVGDRVVFRTRNIADERSYNGVKMDGVLLNHCLHHFTADVMRDIITYAFRALEPGGIMIILDVFLERDKVRPVSGAIFSLYMMMNTVFGEVHPTDEIASVARKLGMDVTVKRLDNLEDDAILIARKAKIGC